jgi:hypothetical protein
MFAAHRTLEIALALNLVPCFTPVESPESNGMAEAFVKPSSATASGSARPRMPPQSLLSSIAGWRTTTTFTRFSDWATDHPANTSFPNPLRLRFSGVNSTPVRTAAEMGTLSAFASLPRARRKLTTWASLTSLRPASSGEHRTTGRPARWYRSGDTRLSRISRNR